MEPDSAGLRQGLRSAVSNKLSGDAAAAGPRATLSSSLEPKSPTLGLDGVNASPCSALTSCASSGKLPGFLDLDTLVYETGTIYMNSTAPWNWRDDRRPWGDVLCSWLRAISALGGIIVTDNTAVTMGMKHN